MGFYGTSSPLAAAWWRMVQPMLLCCPWCLRPDVDCCPRSLELLQVAWKNVAQQVLSLSGAVQAHAVLALKMCACCPWVGCWPKGACSCCPWRSCRVEMVMSCCPAAPAFSFHVAVLGAALHVHELLSSFCELLSSSFASCRPTFASFEKGGHARGDKRERCCPSTLQAAVQQLWSYCPAAFAAGLVPHVSCLQQKPAPPHAFNKILQ
jgi:hypothetical protein